MRTAADIRKTLTRVANMVANGKLESKQANAITMACNAVLSSIRTDEQEKKIEELTQLLEEVTQLRERH